MSHSRSELLEQGKQFFKAGDLKSALETFEKGLEAEPRNLNYKYNIALVQLKQHKYEEGLTILEQVISADPHFKKTAYLFAAISCKHAKKVQKALEYADRGIQVFASFLDLVFYRGKIHKELNNVDSAIEDMKRVISIQKDHVEALYHLSYLYFQKQLMTHAMGSLSSAIYHDHDKNSEWRVEALKLRARLYLAEGKLKQAKKDLLKLKIQQKNEPTAEIYYLQGKLQIQENSVSEAVISFEKCLREKGSSGSKQHKPESGIFEPPQP